MTGKRKKLKSAIEKSIMVPPDAKSFLLRSMDKMGEKKLEELKIFFQSNDDQIKAIEKKYGKIMVPPELKAKKTSKKRCSKRSC